MKYTWDKISRPHFNEMLPLELTYTEAGVENTCWVFQLNTDAGAPDNYIIASLTRPEAIGPLTFSMLLTLLKDKLPTWADKCAALSLLYEAEDFDVPQKIDQYVVVKNGNRAFSRSAAEYVKLEPTTDGFGVESWKVVKTFQNTEELLKAVNGWSPKKSAPILSQDYDHTVLNELLAESEDDDD